MSEVKEPAQKIFARPLAIGLGVALLLGYAFATGFAAYEKSHRSTLEHADDGNGVGDKTFFRDSFDPAKPLLNFDGHSLYFVDRVWVMDFSMIKAGMDDANTYAIYKLAGAKNEEASFLYVKISQYHYVKLKRQ